MNPFLKYLSQNTLVVLLVLGIVIALNYLSVKFPQRWDLTDEKEYTLSGSSIKVIDRLEDRLTIKLYYSKKMPAVMLPIRERVADVIEEFKAYAKTPVVIEYIDPDLNEDRERETLELGIVPLQLNVIEKDKQEVRKVYMGMALYYRDKRQVIPVVAQVQNMEYLMDLSILNLTQKEKPKIGVYLGANQSRYRLVDEIVKEMGQLVPITEDVKELWKMKLDALVIVDPVEIKKEFLEQWDQLIDKGTMILIFAGNIDVQDDMKPTEVFTGMDEWLAAKGVGIGSELLLDIEQNAQAGFNTGYIQVYLPYPFWAKVFKEELNRDHIITAGLEEIMYPWTNTLQVYNDKDNPWKPEVLVKSSPKSFLQKESVPNVDPQYVNEMESMPTFKQYPLTVVLTKEGSDSEKTGQIFVTATHHLLQDQFLQQSQSNIVFLTNMIEYAAWGDYLIGVRSRGSTARPLKELSATDKAYVKWGVTFSVPVFSIVLGLFVLLLLKKKRQRKIAALQL